MTLLTISTAAMMTSNVVAPSGTDRRYCATITPNEVSCGETVIFTLTITNDASSEDDIGSIDINIGSDWTGVTAPTVTSTNPAGLSWTGSLSGNDPRLAADGTDDRNELDPGESLTATFSATAPATLDNSQCGDFYECYTFDLTVYDDRNFGGSQFSKYPSGSCYEPKICVSCFECTQTTTETTTELDTTTETTIETFSDCTITTDTITETATELDTTTETTTETTTATTTIATIEECYTGDGGVSNFGKIRCEGANIIVGAASGPFVWNGAAGTQPADWIDATASTIWDLNTVGVLYWDNNPTEVNQATGATVLPGHEVMSGGPIVNAPVKYYESTKLAPIYYKATGGYARFFDSSTDTQIVGAQLLGSDIGPSKDMFVIQILQKPGTDADPKYALICYGFAGRGTLASSIYFKTVIEPNLSSYTDSYYIVQWNDTNGNSYPDMPSTDTYTVIASGP
jgi:hypothetical protein